MEGYLAIKKKTGHLLSKNKSQKNMLCASVGIENAQHGRQIYRADWAAAALGRREGLERLLTSLEAPFGVMKMCYDCDEVIY